MVRGLCLWYWNDLYVIYHTLKNKLLITLTVVFVTVHICKNIYLFTFMKNSDILNIQFQRRGELKKL